MASSPGKALLLAGSFGVGAVIVGALALQRTRGRASPASRPTTPKPLPPASPSLAQNAVNTPASPRWKEIFDRSTISPMSNIPTLESWRALYQMLGADVPIEVSMAWTGEESGGNPCAIGGLPAAGAAEPQEYGLAQLNAQDPSNVAIATPQSLRSMCGTGPTRADWESVLRPMTDVERVQHAGASINLMRHCRDIAILNFIGSWNWAYNGPDFWMAAKLWHASPALLKTAPTVEKQLGRPPHDFAEFQSHADAIGLANGLGAGHKGGSRGYLDGVWLNVSRVGRAVSHHGAGV